MFRNLQRLDHRLEPEKKTKITGHLPITTQRHVTHSKNVSLKILSERREVNVNGCTYIKGEKCFRTNSTLASKLLASVDRKR